MKEPLVKVTELDGYYATGDYECFCFDKHPGPSEHMGAKRNRESFEQTQQAMQGFAQRTFDKDYDALNRDESLMVYMAVVGEDCRVYPGELLPEGTREEGKQRGRWRITIEFWPEEKE